MDLTELYEVLDLPKKLVEELEKIDINLTEEQTEYFICAMRDKRLFPKAAEQLKEVLGEDKNGYKTLRVLLTSACGTYERYKEKGIPENVFIDTLKCFTRFSREHKESFGEYGFDRGFWVGRQLSLQLFRLGELEYELTELEGRNAISVHIPSDADLSDKKLSESIVFSKNFLQKFFPDYVDAPYFCFSWLLAPALENMLSPSSKIARFRKFFTVTKCDETSESYRQWVFKNPLLAPEDFPEKTSLQRNIKQHVLAGGKIGEGFGFLRNDLF